MEFEDGTMRTYSANLMAESMHNQCGEEGQQYLFFGPILDHKTDEHALSVADQDTVVRGKSPEHKTTKGWK